MRRTTFTRHVLIASVFGLFGLGTTTSQAGIIITKTRVQEIADPTFLYTFTVEVNDDCVLQPGNFFTVFDLFAPPDELALPDHPPTAPSPFWAFTDPPFGPSPFGPSSDDTDRLNVAWIYFGPIITGPTVIGDFTVTIRQAVPVLPTVVFVSNCGPATESMSEIGSVTVTALPEPATIWSAACGIGLIAGRRWRRKRTSST